MYNILLVGSDQQSIDQIQNTIDWSHYGFFIQDTVVNISDGLSLINERNYDLYLLNLTQLDILGFKFCKQIRKLTANPILLIGGDKDFNLIRQAMNLRVNDYLPNPLIKSELIDSLLKVKQIIDEKKENIVDYPSHT